MNSPVCVRVRACMCQYVYVYACDCVHLVVYLILMFTLLEQTGHILSGDNKVHSSDATSSNPADCFNNGKCAWTVLCICMYGYVFVCVLVFMCVPVCQCVGM